MSGYFKAFYTSGDDNKVKVDMGMLGMLILIGTAAFVISLQINSVFNRMIGDLIKKFADWRKTGDARGIKKALMFFPPWAWSLLVAVIVCLAMIGFVSLIVNSYAKNNSANLKATFPLQKRTE